MSRPLRLGFFMVSAYKSDGYTMKVIGERGGMCFASREYSLI